MINKQEAIDKIKALKPDEQCLHEYQPEEWEAFQDGFDDGKCYVELIIEQLDESEKPVVPKFVADWYEKYKNDLSNAIGDFYIDYINDYISSTSPEFQSGFLEWFSDNSDTAIETLVKMKLYGYEIEKEKLYEVFLKRNGAQLGVCIPDGEDKAQFTEEELKEFEFDNLNVYEVKEVEE